VRRCNGQNRAQLEEAHLDLILGEEFGRAEHCQTCVRIEDAGSPRAAVATAPETLGTAGSLLVTKRA
jgi:hypothetical protein